MRTRRVLYALPVAILLTLAIPTARGAETGGATTACPVAIETQSQALQRAATSAGADLYEDPLTQSRVLDAVAAIHDADILSDDDRETAEAYQAYMQDNLSAASLDVLDTVQAEIQALGILPSGLKKLLDQPFTLLDPSTGVGYFFDALYKTGAWYRFIGLAQVAAALLLLVPRTATLGAAVYFPIILNIWVITVGMHFRGTWAVTSLMLLGSTYLICWDYDRFEPMLPRARRNDAV